MNLPDANTKAGRNSPCPCGSGKRYKHCCGLAGQAGSAQPGAPDSDGRRLDELMQAALSAQRANDLEEAERLYRMALDRSPENIDALHMLGVVHYSKGELELAEGLLTAAEALCKGTMPALAHNLSLVRMSAEFVRGEKTIQSLLDADDAQEKLGFGLVKDPVREQSTKLIAFYLPQFHRIPENDLWWGEGFTEWMNVKRARANFDGHYQPHEPGEFGYYDLSDEQVLIRQAALAREYGISGFCFYYYWFSGRRLLEMPTDRLLRSGKPDFPYCLCWANENWSRNWDGGNRDLLVEQRYFPEDAENFILGLLPHFRDHRYIRVSNRPLLMVYRVGLIPDPIATFDTWRAVCRTNGMEPPYIVVASTFDNTQHPSTVGADAVSEFPPHGVKVSLALRNRLKIARPEYKGHLVSYPQTITSFLAKPIPDYSFFPGIVPSWDNTARRQDEGLCILDTSPAAFELWLRELVYRASRKSVPDERIVFINAWNEWAEGCHLEPDKRHGRAWLEACRNARLIPRHYQGIFGVAPATTPAPASAPGSRLTAKFPMIELERPAEISNPGESVNAQTSVITLFKGGQPLPDAPLLWRDTLPERLVTDHEQALVTPALEIFCIADAVLHGPGWVSRGNSVLFDQALYPKYCRDWYQGKRIYNAVDRDLTQLIERRYRAGWHVTHFNCGVYGHWLGEIMPKLLAIQEFLRRWPEYIFMPIFMPSIFPQFVYAHTRTLLPYVPVITYDPQFEYIRTQSVFMPTWGTEHVYNQWIGEQTDQLPSPRNPGMPKRIFVSRRLKSTFRALDNLKELEAIAGEEGLTIVYPEDHSLERQIALFQSAGMVVGEYGSALHNAIFSTRGTLVIALNWINAYQSRIARLKGHRIGYLLPTSGTEIEFSPDAPMQHYTIDPVSFRAKLREAMGEDARLAI